MNFRERILERFALKSQPAKQPDTTKLIPEKLQAFTRRELETSINLYLHLKTMGCSFEDLIAFINQERRKESTARAHSAVKSVMVLTREQRKHMKKASLRKRSRQ